ncbi:MAG: PLP-dependent aminotransferase family protein [Bacillota bacterium]|nr:PLP-dependent aminotransferase family protein [Bacillota bacterium]
MFIVLGRNCGISIKKQLYDAISAKILRGELSEGEKLPSSRELADSLGIARNTVIEIYEQLVAEAYLYTVNGKGTFVSEVPASTVGKISSEKKITRNFTEKNDIISFECGIPDLGSFPKKLWFEAVRSSLDRSKNADLGYINSSGYKPLRDSLVDYLSRYKGISCSYKQIIITNGTSDAVNLLALLFRKTCGQALVESAAASFVADIFKLYDYIIHPVPLDESGICTHQLPDMNNCLIFVTPSHQFPLGGTLPINRRQCLCAYAKAHGHYIIEDDYDSEFRYSGAPVNSIFQIAPESVIHIGTFSKTLAPFLRLGYIVLPERLVPLASRLQRKLYRRVNTMDQMAINYLIENGKYIKHVNSMCKLYNKKMQRIVGALNEKFGAGIKILGMNSGLHVTVQFKGITFNRDSMKVLQRYKVCAEPLSDYMLETSDFCDTMILGFGHLSESEITEGISRLKEGISSLGSGN